MWHIARLIHSIKFTHEGCKTYTTGKKVCVQFGSPMHADFLACVIRLVQDFYIEAGPIQVQGRQTLS